MKSKTMRKSIRAFTFASLSLLLFFVVWACKKDANFSSDFTTQKEPTSVKVKNAKSWFEDRQHRSLLDSDAHFKKMKPIRLVRK